MDPSKAARKVGVLPTYWMIAEYYVLTRRFGYPESDKIYVYSRIYDLAEKIGQGDDK